MRGILITADDEISVVDLPDPTLDAMQKAVGGYIEHVNPRGLPSPFCMVVNEDGMALELPQNLAGTLMYSILYPILGDILVLKDGCNEHGEPDIVGLTAEEIEGLLNAFSLGMPFLKEAARE